ncbi:MAG: response regulator [Geobacteraceae bacterium]|nr:response regulator [Geobacteraceae bacterium]
MAEKILEQELWILGLNGCDSRGKSVCRYLKEGGYRARTAKLEELAERRPLGILLDLSPYSTDGWGIFLELKKNPQTRDIAVLPLFLSEEGKIGGVFPAAGFFTLPIDPDYLKKRLVVLGLTEEAEVWDLQVLLVSRNGEEPVAKAIESLGFEVVKAYTGKEGVALATTEPRYMAFSTLMLPDMSAFELMDRFRLYPHTKNLPFFVLMKESMKEGEKMAMGHQIEHLVRKKELSQDEFLRYLRKRG